MWIERKERNKYNSNNNIQLMKWTGMKEGKEKKWKQTTSQKRKTSKESIGVCAEELSRTLSRSFATHSSGSCAQEDI